MMENLNSSAVMHDWRNYLQNGTGDIFEIIKKAIMVAASDHPIEFLNKRKQIAQTLFSCELINCSECDKCKKQISSKVDEETIRVSEVLKIKEILDHKNQDEVVLYESLTKLQHMNICVEILKATAIGKSVNALKKHASKNVLEIATTLIKAWTRMTDEWIMAIKEDDGKSNKNQIKPLLMEKKTAPTCKQQTEKMVGINSKENLLKDPVTPDQNISKRKDLDDSEDEIIQKKFEATKRRLHEGYEDVENRKKKRKIQFIELHELPTQGFRPQS